ncbi:MAG: hypothetical protein QM571_03140 [Micrococcaceae bacterium]
MQANQFNKDDKPRKLKPALISLIALVIVTVIGAIVYATTRNKDKDVANTTNSEATETTTPTRTTASSAPATSSASATPATTFKDGTYRATGDYTTPGGTESVTVNLTIKGDKVAAVETTGSATSGSSAEYQEKFLSAYKTEVVGKPVNDIHLTRVAGSSITITRTAGSSLTSNGFNAAIDKIKVDAKS